MVREIQGCFSKLHVKTSYYGLIYRRKQLFFFCGWTWFFFRNFLCAHLCIWFSKFMCFLIDGAIVLWFIWGKNTGAIIRIQWQYEENLCAHIMCTQHTRIHVCTMKKKQSLFLCAHPPVHMVESDVCRSIVRLFYGSFELKIQGQSSEFDDNARKIYVHTCAH